MKFVNGASGLCECGDCLCLPPRLQCIPALASELAVCECNLSGLGQSEKVGCADTYLRPLAPDDDPLDPAPCTRVVDTEKETMPVKYRPGDEIDRTCAANSAFSGCRPLFRRGCASIII